MTPAEVGRVWARAWVTFEKSPVSHGDRERMELLLQAYSEALIDVDAETADLFMRWWCANGKWWPKPGDLRDWIIEQVGESLTVDGIWLELLDHFDAMRVRDNETTRLPMATRHDHRLHPWPQPAPDLAPVIRSYGGWERISERRNDEFIRKEVKKSLEAVAKRRRLEAQQPGSERFRSLALGVPQALELGRPEVRELEAGS